MSTVVITVGGVDITSIIEYRSAFFESMVNGKVGRCRFRVKDLAHAQALATGDEITVDIDGTRAWTGFASKISRAYHLPVIDATPPATAARYLIIDGADVNLLLEKRVIFNQTNAITAGVAGSTNGVRGPFWKYKTSGRVLDTTALTELFDHWLDLTGDGLDTSSLIENVGYINTDQDANPFGGGQTLAVALGEIAKVEAAIYYIDPDKKLVYTDVDTPNASFGLSDNPGVGEVGYRKAEVFYDGSDLVNDAMIWGTAKGAGYWTTVRTQDSASIAAHGRWQTGEVRLDMYKQGTVNKRANTIIYGSPSNKRGHKDDKIIVRCTVKEPGFRVAQKVNFESAAHGYSDVLPIRRMRITFANPTSALYELELSHEIDVPFDLHEFIPVKFPAYDVPRMRRLLCPVFDSFSRTDESALGTADAGVTWIKTSGAGSSQSVSGGVAHLGAYYGNSNAHDLHPPGPWQSSTGFTAQTLISFPTAYDSGNQMFEMFLLQFPNYDTQCWAGIGRFSTGLPSRVYVGYYDSNGDVGEAEASFSITSGESFYLKWEFVPEVSSRLRAWPSTDSEPATWSVEQSLVGVSLPSVNGIFDISWGVSDPLEQELLIDYIDFEPCYEFEMRRVCSPVVDSTGWTHGGGSGDGALGSQYVDISDQGLLTMNAQADSGADVDDVSFNLDFDHPWWAYVNGGPSTITAVFNVPATDGDWYFQMYMVYVPTDQGLGGLRLRAGSKSGPLGVSGFNGTIYDTSAGQALDLNPGQHVASITFGTDSSVFTVDGVSLVVEHNIHIADMANFNIEFGETSHFQATPNTYGGVWSAFMASTQRIDGAAPPWCVETPVLVDASASLGFGWCEEKRITVGNLTDFTFSPYMEGTSILFFNGYIQRVNIDYYEMDGGAGTIRLSQPAIAGDVLRFCADAPTIEPVTIQHAFGRGPLP